MMSDERADVLGVFVHNTSLKVWKDYLDVVKVRPGYTEVVVRNWGPAHMDCTRAPLHRRLGLGCEVAQKATYCSPLLPSGL
jgi:hypothetical protein